MAKTIKLKGDFIKTSTEVLESPIKKFTEKDFEVNKQKVADYQKELENKKK